VFAPGVARIPPPAVVKISHRTETSSVATETIDNDDDENVRRRQRCGATAAGGRVRGGRGGRRATAASAAAAAEQGDQGVPAEYGREEAARARDDARGGVDGRAAGTHQAAGQGAARGTWARRAAGGAAVGRGQQRGRGVVLVRRARNRGQGDPILQHYPVVRRVRRQGRAPGAGVLHVQAGDVPDEQHFAVDDQGSRGEHRAAGGQRVQEEHRRVRRHPVRRARRRPVRPVARLLGVDQAVAVRRHPTFGKTAVSGGVGEEHNEFDRKRPQFPVQILYAVRVRRRFLPEDGRPEEDAADQGPLDRHDDIDKRNSQHDGPTGAAHGPDRP